MISFAELTKQVHTINDMILSDMICGNDDSADELVVFSKHLLATKFWFARISYANKKRYLLTLLQDVRSAWTLSLLLKSMWNCRLKDAVMSVAEPNSWLSSYDQAPMDHNRTALPVATLAQAMKNDRIWFLALDPESQALVLSELLTVSGGPAMWEVLRRARTLYDRYQDSMLQNVLESSVLPAVSTMDGMKATKSNIAQTSPNMAASSEAHGVLTAAQKELDVNLAMWNSTIKSLRDSLKLEELEMTFQDGTKRRIWKVNRPKPDVLETVDFVQLLPSSVGKLILSYLPRATLGDYARVNRYWAYLVDEYKAELAARVKINADFERLNEILTKHDEILDEYINQKDLTIQPVSEPGMTTSAQIHLPFRPNAPSVRASERSGGAFSLKFFSEKLKQPPIVQKPIRNLAELTDRLENRGAADENIWKWCENIVAHATKLKRRQQRVTERAKKEKKYNKTSEPAEPVKKENEEEGVLILGNVYFPCPLMKLSLVVPLQPPLYKDPVRNTLRPKPSKRVSDGTLSHVPRTESVKRYNRWTRDLSPLYPVFKIPSYQFPPM